MGKFSFSYLFTILNRILLLGSTQNIIAIFSQSLVIRLMVSEDDGSFNLNAKFGCSLVDAKLFLDLAKCLGLNMVGIS